MAEILLQIQQEDLPPKARSVVRVELSQDPQHLTDQIRNALYPGWHTYGNVEELPENLRPKYFIKYENSRQAFIAEGLKPPGFQLSDVPPESPKQVLETRQTYPFVEKLKNINPRYLTALNVALIAFGAETLMASPIHASRDSELTIPLAFIGTGLSLAAMTITAIRSGHLPEVKISFDHN